MNFTIEQWNILKNKVLAALDTISVQHDLNWSGNFWTVRVPNLGVLTFHEHYQRWSIGIKDAECISSVDTMTWGEFEDEIQKLYFQIEWRPNGPAAKEKAIKDRARRDEENRCKKIKSEFMQQLVK